MLPAVFYHHAIDGLEIENVRFKGTLGILITDGFHARPRLVDHVPHHLVVVGFVSVDPGLFWEVKIIKPIHRGMVEYGLLFLRAQNYLPFVHQEMIIIAQSPTVEKTKDILTCEEVNNTHFGDYIFACVVVAKPCCTRCWLP